MNAVGVLIAVGCFVPTFSATLGNEGCTVPPLSCFGSVPTKRITLTAVKSDLSGITYNAETGTLFAVNNGDQKAFEVTTDGALIAEWNLTGISDPEGISWMGGRKFAVTDENPASLYELELKAGGGAAYNVTKLMSGISPAAAENLGFEGVAYLKGVGYFMAQEMKSPSIWKYVAGSDSATSLYGDLKVTKGHYMLGALTRGCDAVDELFYISKDPKQIVRIAVSDGHVKEQYAGEVCKMGQPEGITFYQPSGGKVTMVVVGEPMEMLVFEANSSCTDSLNTTTGTLHSCPTTKTAFMGCEKTIEDGGCKFSRCDKVKTDHEKICTDKTPGVTDCNVTQCKAHCKSKGTGGAINCTHYAFDAKEKECYLFQGCNAMHFEQEYVLFAMQDPTCEKTLEEHPLGCQKRRCSKTNNHAKVCTDTTPGTTDCSLQECKAKCQKHLDFKCTTYSYDAAEKECYIWETCQDEGDELDYSTYVLVDPSCEKSLSAGGCFQRRCDKIANQNDKVCSSSDACKTAEQCRQLCADYTNFSCTAYAHDPTDKDCYVFETCLSEGFDDDYTTYMLPFDEKMATLTKTAVTCDKYLSDGGCSKRRCSKTNQHNKICTDDSNETTCTLNECATKCKDHSDFMCFYFAYDGAGKECYLFADCKDEGDEIDYTLYKSPVLVGGGLPLTAGAPVRPFISMSVAVLFAAMLLTI